MTEADRNIAASVAFAAAGGAYLALTDLRNWYAWAMIAVGALGVVLGVVLRVRGPRA